MTVEGNGTGAVTGGEAAADAVDRIRGALRGLRYGTVTAVVQDGVVIQVERTEKIRLERRSTRAVADEQPVDGLLLHPLHRVEHGGEVVPEPHVA